MNSLTSSSSSLCSLANFNSQPFSSVLFVVYSRRLRSRPKFKPLNLTAVSKTDSSSRCSFKKGLFYNGSLQCGFSPGFLRCIDRGSEDDLTLETQSLELVALPNKKELVDAGRLDLVDTIGKEGDDLKKREIEGNEVRFSGATSFASSSTDYSQPPVRGDTPEQTEAKKSGIEGILGRLEKDRINALVHEFREEVDSISLGNNEEKDEWNHRTTADADQKSSSDDPQKLSDDWKFQQNKITNTQNRLRSILAKLAVLVGKTELALRDAHNIVQENQRMTDSSHEALQYLKPVCIAWPISASEVLVTGSFDGWSSKRKMTKSWAGIFSLGLLLYPGKYEMKFIVDGQWKVDHLRPIVNNNGHENNLLIVHADAEYFVH